MAKDKVKTNKIPAGYRITSVSFENDGDNYRTIVQEGLSEDEAKLIGALGKTMKKGTGLENAYEPNDDEVWKGHNIYLKVFYKHAHMFTESQIKDFQEEFACISDYISEKITGYSDQGYELRELKSMKIEYIPVEISIEDVTKKFMK